MGTTSIVGRLKCVHPDLGFEGGVTLEGHVKSTLTKISDAINSRWFVSLDLNNAASVDFEHNFKCNFSELRILLYNIDGSDELTRITKGGTPDLDDFAIIAKVGSETTHITVTNNTGSQQDIALVLVQGKGAEVLNDLSDVDTTGKEDGQALVYSLSQGKFIPGASGDASFKFQSINSSGTQLVIKKGYIRLSDGRVLYLASDLTIDVSAILTIDGYYYTYLDVNTLADSSIVSGRKLVAITSSNFSYQTTAPEDNNLTRYISMGQITRSGGLFTLATTEAFRTYDFPLGADKSLEYTLPLQTIGTVGNAGQIAAGHQLASTSFPSAAIGANLSWYNLPDMNDDSGNGRTLTNNNAATFGNGILGDANQAVSMNGSNQWLNSSNSHFNPGDNDFTCGGWFYRANWATGFVGLIAQWQSLKQSFLINTGASGGIGVILINASVDGTNVTYSSSPLPITAGWAHIVLKYEASLNKFSLYFNNKVLLTHTLASGLYSVTGPDFYLGQTQTSQYFDGKIDEFFFYRGLFSDNDIAKIYSSKLTHSRTLSAVSQKWLMTGISADSQARELFDNIVDMDTDDLYFDLSDESSTTQVEMKLYNRSSTGMSKAAKPRTLELTTDALDALLPITHSLGVVPEISLKVKNLSNDYEYHDAGTYFVATSTQIKTSGTTLVSALGSGVTVVLTYATANVAQFVPNRFWNCYKASASQAVAANDKVYADPSGGSFNLTLPAIASLGDGIVVFDYKANFGPATKVTLLQNGHKINGLAADFDLDVPGRVWQIEYVDVSYGFSVR